MREELRGERWSRMPIAGGAGSTLSLLKTVMRNPTLDMSFAQDAPNCGNFTGDNTYNFSNPNCYPADFYDAEAGGLLSDTSLIATAFDAVFVSISGYLVFLMQCGFAMLTAGSVRTKNTKNVLIKNFLDACVGACAYYLFGFAFAYDLNGESTKFISSKHFAMHGVATGDYHTFFFQWAFAATAATIVSGSVAERTSFYAYLGYAAFLTGFVYPVVSHWVWGVGWLGDGDTFKQPYLDFAGSSVVHMVGGFAGLTGAIIVGPRLGRFDAEGKVVPMPGHSATLCTLGTFLLWFGWYGFNPGSTLGVVSFAPTDADGFSFTSYGEPVATNLASTFQRCIVTTTLAPAAAGVTTLVILKFRDHIFDLIAVLNGALAGLVGVTASCAWIEPWAAVVIGIFASFIYIGAAWLLLKLKIDDPLEAFPIHGACGVWGVLCVGIFNVERHVLESGYTAYSWGFLYGGSQERGLQFGVQVAGLLAIAVWVSVLIGIFFILMKAVGLLRISAEEELLGNDVSKHGGTAYPDDVINTAEAEAQKELRSYQKDNYGKDESMDIKAVEAEA